MTTPSDEPTPAGPQAEPADPFAPPRSAYGEGSADGEPGTAEPQPSVAVAAEPQPSAAVAAEPHGATVGTEAGQRPYASAYPGQPQPTAPLPVGAPHAGTPHPAPPVHGPVPPQSAQPIEPPAAAPAFAPPHQPAAYQPAAHQPAAHRAPAPAQHAPGAPSQGFPPYPPQHAPSFPPYPPTPHGPYATLEPEPRRRRSLSVAWVVPLVVLALVAGLVGGLIGARLQRDDHLAEAGLPAAPAVSAPASRPAGSVAGIAAEVLPSVVSIQVQGAQGAGTGSGFVLRQDGYILTNNHVVTEGSAQAASSIVVTFSDGSKQQARIVGRTPAYDLAVVKVDVQGLTPLALGDSDKVVVGDPVVAIGAPLGLAGTVTTGIVSALNRPVSAGAGTASTDTAFINAIQTDAAINPGNSGGPLVDASGQVIGINSAIAQPPGATQGSGGSIGLGFAIPSNQARRTATQLIETGHATYPIIGVLLDQRYSGQGVRVATAAQGSEQPVTKAGPADRAGIKAGDIILSIDGRPVTDPDELIVAIRARTPGDTVTLRVRTGTHERDVPVKLDESQPE
jgi:putative serine protease PepD